MVVDYYGGMAGSASNEQFVDIHCLTAIILLSHSARFAPKMNYGG
jgi:hypothetical protein